MILFHSIKFQTKKVTINIFLKNSIPLDEINSMHKSAIAIHQSRVTALKYKAAVKCTQTQTHVRHRFRRNMKKPRNLVYHYESCGFSFHTSHLSVTHTVSFVLHLNAKRKSITFR